MVRKNDLPEATLKEICEYLRDYSCEEILLEAKLRRTDPQRLKQLAWDYAQACCNTKDRCMLERLPSIPKVVNNRYLRRRKAILGKARSESRGSDGGGADKRSEG